MPPSEGVLGRAQRAPPGADNPATPEGWRPSWHPWSPKGNCRATTGNTEDKDPET